MTLFHVSESGLQTALTGLAVGANNIANVATPAFKAARTDQVDVRGGGARVADIRVNVLPGPIEIGDGGFQLGIAGDGFFRVATPRGDRFLRAGNFHVDGGGSVVTAEGFPLEPPVRLPSGASRLQVSPSGAASALFSDGRSQAAGQIELSRFPNPGGLTLEGDNLAAAGPAAGAPVAGRPGAGGNGALVFGALEGSNVDLAREVVEQLVQTAVAKANLAAIRVQDRVLGSVVDLRG